MKLTLINIQKMLIKQNKLISAYQIDPIFNKTEVMSAINNSYPTKKKSLISIRKLKINIFIKKF